VLQLEAAFLTVRVDIVGNRRAFQANGGGENIDHGAMQPRGAIFFQAGRDRLRVNARFKQRFIGVDVSHAAQESLIEQQRLDARVTLLQQLQKIFERDVERVRTQRLGPFQQSGAPFDAAEMADVVINQQPFIKLKDGARVGSGFLVEQQLAGHSKMNGKDTLVQLQHDKLAVSANRFYRLIAHAPAKFGKFLADHVVRGKLGVQYRAPGEFRRQRSNHSFNFR